MPLFRVHGLKMGFAIFLGLLSVTWTASVQIQLNRHEKICRESSASPGEGKPVTAGRDAEMRRGDSPDFQPRFTLKPGQWVYRTTLYPRGVLMGPFKGATRPGQPPQRYVCEADKVDPAGECATPEGLRISCERACH